MPRQGIDIQPQSGMKLRQKVYEAIRQAIITCELQPGTPISEAQFAERLEVSKTPVREALTSLQQYHLVEYRPNRGFSVTPITLKDIQEIFEARQFYEAALFRLAIRYITPAEVEHLEMLCAQSWEQDDLESITRYIEINLEFHMTIACASRNSRLIHHYGNIMDEAQRLVYMDLRSNPLQAFWHGSHHNLFEAVRDRNEEAGLHMIDQMLASGKSRILGMDRYSESWSH